MLTDLRNTGLKTADATDDQVNLHPGCGCFVEGCNDFLITQGIHLCHDPRRNTPTGMLRLPPYHVQEASTQPQRSQDQTVPALRLGITGEHIEDRRRIFTDRLMTGQDSAVCIQLCRRIILISGTKMHITTDSVFLTPHDQRNLTVCLEAM